MSEFCRHCGNKLEGDQSLEAEKQEHKKELEELFGICSRLHHAMLSLHNPFCTFCGKELPGKKHTLAELINPNAPHC